MGVSGGASGGAGALVLLDYNAAVDLANAAAITAATWTDSGAGAQSFTPTSALAQLLVLVTGMYRVGNAAADGGARIQIDGAANYKLGGMPAAASSWPNQLAGSAVIAIGSLSAAVHTVAVQFYLTAAGSRYCRPATAPNTESLRIQVVQMP